MATAEELGAKQREAARLSEDLRALAQSRTDALDHQRGDLVETYEHLMRQREEAYHRRETEIVTQIGALEQKFDSTQAEALQLRADLRVARTQREQAAADLLLQGDQLRALQYSREDEGQRAARAGEELTRQVHELTSRLEREGLASASDAASRGAEIGKVRTAGQLYN